MELGRRCILSSGVTSNPNQAWVSQRLRNLSWRIQDLGLPTLFMICDHDKKFPFAIKHVLDAEGVTVIRTPIQAPVANCYAERWVESVSRECLEWLIILGRVHLESVLAEYVEHYNRARPHRGPQLQPPEGQVGKASEVEEISCPVRLGGVIREYSRLPCAA